jgi:hypothetical protein
MADDRSPERLRKSRRESPDAKDVVGIPVTGTSDELASDSVESSERADSRHAAVTDSDHTSEHSSHSEVKLDPVAQPPRGSSRRLTLMRFRRRPASR